MLASSTRHTRTIKLPLKCQVIQKDILAKIMNKAIILSISRESRT